MLNAVLCIGIFIAFITVVVTLYKGFDCPFDDSASDDRPYFDYAGGQ